MGQFGGPYGLAASAGAGVGSPQGRPACVSGFEDADSTSLKWGSDGELTSLDLHRILARLSVHDAQVSALAEDGGLPLG